VKVISIYHNKGGVGKTTVSVNLAAALRIKGYKVLLIDLDSQANSTFAAGLVKFQFEEDDNLRDKNVFHILESGDFNLVSDIARQSNLFNTPEIDVVPAHISLIEGQYKLNQIEASKTRLIKKLKYEQDKYDFVIIDTPPSRDLYARVAIIASNYLIIPSDLKPFANQGLSSVRSFVSEINEFRDSLGRPPVQILGVLPSKISTNFKSFEKTFPRQKQTIIDHYDFPVMKSIIFDRAALAHCVNQTISVGDLEIPDPKSIFDFAEKNPNSNQSAQEFEALAEEILNKVERG
jgi:cellulose biosynthesis protein BcsQ